MGCVPRQRQALSGSRRKSAKCHWGEDIHDLLFSHLGGGNDMGCARGCEHCVPFAAVCQRRREAWRTTDAAAVSLYTVSSYRGVKTHHTTAVGCQHGKTPGI